MRNIIWEKRKALGLSQEQLARACGVSRQTINAIENNKYDPTLALAFQLSREKGRQGTDPPASLWFSAHREGQGPMLRR